MTEVGYEPQQSTSVRRQLTLTTAAGAVGLLVALHRIIESLVADAGADLLLLSWRGWAVTALLALASLLALSGRLGVASAAPLAGIALPIAFMTSASFVQALALDRLASSQPGMTVALPDRVWLRAAEAVVLAVLAALALGAAPDVRRLRHDVMGLTALVVGVVFVGWQYQEHRLGSWHEAYPLAGFGFDVLIAAAVLVPLIWGLALAQPWRKYLLLGWVVYQCLYWSAWLESRIPQREFPWIYLIPPLLLVTILAALRDEESPAS